MDVLRSRDYEAINEILNDPIIFSTIAEDCRHNQGDFRTTESDDIYYLTPEINGEKIGVIIIHSDSAASYKIHVNMLKKFRKKYSREAVKNCISWFFNETDAEKINCDIPSIYKNVIKCAIDCGFKLEGVREHSYLKNGNALDLVLMGLTRLDYELG